MERRRQELALQLTDAEERLRQQRVELAQLGARLVRERQAQEVPPATGGNAATPQPIDGTGAPGVNPAP
jgi:hypothetical protein